MRRFCLIDGHGIFWRANYAGHMPLTSPTGEPTKATFYYTRALLKLIRRLEPTHLLFAGDAGRQWLIKKELQKDYKADRKPTPPEIVVQLKRCKQITELLGIPIVEVKGYEADDIIATLVRRFARQCDETIIVSGDKDLMQLISRRRNVRQYEPFNEDFTDWKTARRKWGVIPPRILDVQSLCGDGVDNVPGCPGIGPKKAAALIQKYGSPQNVIDNADELTPHLRKAICPATIKMTRALCRLLPVPSLAAADLRTYRFKGPRYDAARPVFRKLGFRRWANNGKAMAAGFRT